MTTPQPQDATNSPSPVSQDAQRGTDALSADFLSASNWQTIQCQCTGCTCTNNAAHIVHIHALHDCNRSDLDPFGNRVELKCSDCLQRLRAQVADELDRINLHGYGRACCGGCGAPIAEVGDVLRTVGRL